DRVSEIRVAAAGAIGTAIERDPSRGADLDRALVTIASSDPDPAVRNAALWSIKGSRADAATIGELVRILGDGADAAPRQAAAEALSDVGPEHKQGVVAALVAALARETDPEVRKAELLAVVRAGRQDALPALEAVERSHPDLATHARDYIDGLR